MDQSAALYTHAPTAALLAPWLAEHLPQLDPTVRHRLVQLVAGLVEHHSVLIEQIARSSAFRATPESNATQVRRILRDQRVSMEQTYFPLVRHLLAELPGTDIYLGIDESAHTTVMGLVQVVLITDGMALPLGWVLVAPNTPWAEDARDLLGEIAALMPPHRRVVVLADRGHAGEPFITCLEALGWFYIIRIPSNTYVFTDEQAGWRQVRHMKPRHYPLRRLSGVQVWKEMSITTNLVIYRYERAGFAPVIWYVATNLPAELERCTEYACRWWQENGFKLHKSALFGWERSRITTEARIDVLLVGIGVALWTLWVLGRAHERIPQIKPTTTTEQRRRRRIVQEGLRAIADLCARRRDLAMPALPEPRVLNYKRTFAKP